MNFPRLKNNEIFKIHFLILENLQLHLSVTLRHTGANSILDNPINRVIIILFLRYEVFLSVIWWSYYNKKHIFNNYLSI